MIRAALAVLLSLCAGSVRAQSAAETLVEQALQTSNIAISASNSPIRAKTAGDDLQAALEGASVAPVRGYKWAVEEELHDSPADVSDLINAASRSLRPDGIHVPGPTPYEGLEALKKLHSDGRVGVGKLDPSTHGTYDFNDRDHTGFITLSERLMIIAQLTSRKLAAAVGFHEIGHFFDEDMKEHGAHNHANRGMDRVVEEEVKAFAMMQRYLRSIYQTESEGREIFATTVRRLRWEQQQAPHPLRAAAIAFIGQANRIYTAVDQFGRPDERKLERLVREWYKPNGAPIGPV